MLVLPHIGGDIGKAGSEAETYFEQLEDPAAQPEPQAEGPKMSVQHISALLMN